ncbi:unnamed protein product [Hymenolepis diminuta]|uniref:Uncharacterized protein n=1 Tax=Hymenolepis diminuta TaxID=6216 RepID=A0A564ZDB8_HYMDI|nr:unnamed protein product [Hymenolepis diminuta]
MSVRDEFDVINAFVKQLEEMSLLRKIKGTGSMIIFRILPKGQFKIEVDNSYPRSLPKWQVVFEGEVVNSPDTPFPVEATTIFQAFICGIFVLKKRRKSEVPCIISLLDPEFYGQLESICSKPNTV